MSASGENTDDRPSAGDAAPTEAGRSAPLLSVVRGEPTAEQLAALIAVVSARGGGEEEPAPPRSRWGAPGYGVRRPLSPGPGAWRASALPQ